MNLKEDLKAIIKGDVLFDTDSLIEYSHDASLFEVRPQLVVFPKDQEDVEKLVSYVASHKKEDQNLSITGRSAGTDMSGGSINDSIIVEFARYFNHTPVINGTLATTEPGVYYRNFEKETLKSNLLFPSYPASRTICAMGGIVNNNSGGEKSLQYGKTERYVKRIKVVLRDGKTYELTPLDEGQLKSKMALPTLEGEIYTKMFNLINDNYDKVMAAKPKVSKNSAGYYLWNVWDKEKNVFDLTKLWVGAQGTLGMMIDADIELVPVHKHREMLVMFNYDMSHLGQIIDTVLPLQPESFESYDKSTLTLALKYFPEFAKQLGTKGMVQTGLAFIPEAMLIMLHGMPELILQIDFTGNDPVELKKKIAILKEKLGPLHPMTRVAVENQEEKYWAIRRESFNLLRQKVREKHTAPFIDDFVIDPHDIAVVLPEVIKMIEKYKVFTYTIAGHVGDGNFHIIPLVDIRDPKVRIAIPALANEVYALINKYKGSITGEHNDGIIRTPFLEGMYGHDIISLFAETKKIWDPDNIFNPRKKIGGTIEYAMSHLRQNW